MQVLAERIIGVIASTMSRSTQRAACNTVPDGPLVDASHWSDDDVLGAGGRAVGLEHATHIANKTRHETKVTDANRKYTLADCCVLVHQMVARALISRGVQNVTVGELRFVFNKTFVLPALRVGNDGRNTFRLLQHVATHPVGGQPHPPHIVHTVLKVDGFAVDLLAAALGNSSQATVAVWPVDEQFTHPENTGIYQSWRASGSREQREILAVSLDQMLEDDEGLGDMELKPREWNAFKKVLGGLVAH
jgi:hypothetical protein